MTNGWFARWSCVGVLASIAASPCSQATIIFEENFEDTYVSNGQTIRCWDAEDHKKNSVGSNPAQQYWPTVFKISQMQYNYAGTVVSKLDGNVNPRKGTGAMRFTWERARYDPADDNNTKKAHLWTNWESSSQKGQARWYGMSMYMYSPSSNTTPSMKADDEPEILVQWHGRPNTTEYNNDNLIPPLTMKHINNSIYFEWYYDTNATTVTPIFVERFYDPQGAVYNKWVDWMFYVKWKNNGTGELEIHRKIIDPATNTGTWTKILDRANINIGYNDESDPQLGIGIYKYTATSDFTYRRIYFDEVTIATTQAEVKP